MSLKACILGILALRDMTGYELKNTFDRSVSYVWSSSSTQIYAALKSLAKDDLVESVLVLQESKPNKRVYKITPEGLNHLQEWLISPAEPRFERNDFLVRIFFANYIEEIQVQEIMEQNLASMKQQVQELQEIRTRVTNRPSQNAQARLYQLMCLDIRVAGLDGMIKETDRQLEHIRSVLPKPAKEQPVE
jgi:DNA-binding PadR family transcriptional regulator